MDKLNTAAGKISKSKTWKSYKPKTQTKENVGELKSLSDP